MGWNNADWQCTVLGGHLLRLETEAKWEMIKTLILSNESELVYSDSIHLYLFYLQ